MLLLSKKDMQQVFSMRDAIKANKKAFAMISTGQFQMPLRTQITAREIYCRAAGIGTIWS
ncbi:MAG: hypothetical protein LKE33_06130 [Acidaminococcus sp.]|jgi:ornithine cyclodeaminase|nr:hypothetical protein [Acidaminococcus sp.]MCI2100842.1 hypothetical protein [Acidaminococcus sp.]MCI2115205.1 hypothetical protein [Acidaminococcus sp.]MCI2116662.1 hypothetical protein [Acidaminococcus sp.]